MSFTWEPREDFGGGRTHDEALFEQVERRWGYHDDEESGPTEVYLRDEPDDDACDFCSERMGDHTDVMRWRCRRGE